MHHEGTIFDIQHFAVHDGPGIRTTVFFKGCSCRCIWCHNPESLQVKPQIEFYPSRCIGCGRCFKVCPQGAHITEGGEHRIDRPRCTGCGRCAVDCFSSALVLKGRNISVDGLLENILSDRSYYEESGGGVTLSGGEPVLQSEFALRVLAACKREGIHTALQTAGNYPFERLESLFPYLDLIMYDIKSFSAETYRSCAGGDRERIFANLGLLGERFGGETAVRTPCVGGVNDTDREIEGIARMAGGLRNIAYYQLIPYHGLAKAKYDALDEQFAARCTTPPPERIKELEALASRYVTVFNQDRGIIPRH
ncbi:MAG: glycyl-radical enzyme activating protein [Treponema sp.]|jgi:pyruvate formate lyase activating enzyme|nr:glycyl-radical enzyme activating protein [Treponema sp.]